MPLSLEPFPVSDPPPPGPLAEQVQAADGDTRINYHPRSGKPSEAYRPKAYSARKRSSRDKPDSKFWWPFFKTREDFLISEILIDSGLSNAQLDKLLKLINRCINGKGTLTLSRHADLQAAWDHASLKLTPVS
jgi:hypothetical protein